MGLVEYLAEWKNHRGNHLHSIDARLPKVSWIIPMGFQSEHPNSMSADDAAIIVSKIDTIAANPEVWILTDICV